MLIIFFENFVQYTYFDKFRIISHSLKCKAEMVDENAYVDHNVMVLSHEDEKI